VRVAPNLAKLSYTKLTVRVKLLPHVRKHFFIGIGAWPQGRQCRRFPCGRIPSVKRSGASQLAVLAVVRRTRRSGASAGADTAPAERPHRDRSRLRPNRSFAEQFVRNNSLQRPPSTSKGSDWNYNSSKDLAGELAKRIPLCEMALRDRHAISRSRVVRGPLVEVISDIAPPR
jgi:hypothetical protein